MTPLFINGKFSAQRLTGVQRYAECLLRALDELPTPLGVPPLILLCPQGARPLGLRRIVQRSLGPAGLPLHAWEQFVLPFAARSGLLLNLSGSAPAWGMRRQICTLHDAAVFDVPQAFSRTFLRWYTTLFGHAARRALALITVSEFSLQRLSQVLPAASGRLSVIPNGADHLEGVAADERVLDALNLRGTRFFLAVATANPVKNLPRLKLSMAGLDAALVIVGGTNARVFAAPAVEPVPGAARVVHAGPLGDAEMKALLQHAVALVCPSLYEGFGLPVVEAMATGCPVASSGCAALPEVTGAAALTFDPLSGAAITAAMQTLLDNPTLSRQLKAAGHAQAGRYRWSHSAALLADLLATVQQLDRVT